VRAGTRVQEGAAGARQPLTAHGRRLTRVEARLGSNRASDAGADPYAGRLRRPARGVRRPAAAGEAPRVARAGRACPCACVRHPRRSMVARAARCKHDHRGRNQPTALRRGAPGAPREQADADDRLRPGAAHQHACELGVGCGSGSQGAVEQPVWLGGFLNASGVCRSSRAGRVLGRAAKGDRGTAFTAVPTPVATAGFGHGPPRRPRRSARDDARRGKGEPRRGARVAWRRGRAAPRARPRDRHSGHRPRLLSRPLKRTGLERWPRSGGAEPVRGRVEAGVRLRA
jgi:hypothetical protein